MVQRCNFCGLFASQDYQDSGLYRINDLIYCSLSCFHDEDKKVPKPKKKKSLGKILIEGLKESIKHSKGKIKLRETKRRSKAS